MIPNVSARGLALAVVYAGLVGAALVAGSLPEQLTAGAVVVLFAVRHCVRTWIDPDDHVGAAVFSARLRHPKQLFESVVSGSTARM